LHFFPFPFFFCKKKNPLYITISTFHTSNNIPRGEGRFDFAVRTPCTPSRWDEFDAEMTAAWEVCYSRFHIYTYRVYIS
jgi:hypothetical protein